MASQDREVDDDFQQHLQPATPNKPFKLYVPQIVIVLLGLQVGDQAAGTT